VDEFQERQIFLEIHLHGGDIVFRQERGDQVEQHRLDAADHLQRRAAARNQLPQFLNPPAIPLPFTENLMVAEHFVIVEQPQIEVEGEEVGFRVEVEFQVGSPADKIEMPGPHGEPLPGGGVGQPTEFPARFQHEKKPVERMGVAIAPQEPDLGAFVEFKFQRVAQVFDIAAFRLNHEIINQSPVFTLSANSFPGII